ncbi:extracellular solute-binding protein [Paenibacillus chungangensis]|uniref:Extracellular solute-binding protein n=1 Tax=Paenibacillus chungangensis TaxID=696535 RepID=A0ABW3HLJ2_9BACL
MIVGNQNRSSGKGRITMFLMAITLSLTLLAMNALLGPGPAEADDVGEAAGDEYSALNDLYAFIEEQFGSMYHVVSQEWREAGIPDGGQSFSIQAKDYTAASSETELSVQMYNGTEQALVWRNTRDNWVEYEVEVPETGLYEMVVRYHSYSDDNESPSYRPATLAVSWDGKFPFREARSISFPRFFRDEMPLKLDRFGDHVRPKPIEINRWAEVAVTDREDSYTGPLLWNLTEGKHVLRFRGFSPLVLDTIQFRPPGSVPDYKQALAQYPAYESFEAEPIVIEAEHMAEKNEVSIQILSDQDAFMTPQADGDAIFNGVGGNRWNDSGETITWEFAVERDGWYNIALRALNNLQSNVTSFRKIMIDGEVPFREMLAYGIPYSGSWQKVVIEDEKQEPYAFYLEAGKHTLSMSVTYSPHKELQVLLEQVIQELGMVSRDLQVLTKGDDDPNRTWDIEMNFPEIPEALVRIQSTLTTMADLWLEGNGEKDNNYQSLLTSISDLDDLVKYPNNIPSKKDTLSMVQSKVASITNSLTKMPMSLDQIMLVPHKDKFPRMTANFWEKTRSGIMNFGRSFTEDNTLSDNEDDVLNVWMAYGRDYVNLLQELADQYFTPQTGIPVKIDLLPREELLVLANATGEAPDVALGINEGRPSEFAFRNSAVDLSTFEGFDQLMENFAPGSMLSYYYDGGYYAVPETVQLKMMFYRKDILDHLELEVPKTWDDVYEMLPTLQQDGYNFFIPTGEFLTFVYQNGADFYAEDGMSTGLDSPEGFASFKQVSELFSLYGIERQIPSFYQHFRDGDMPIGIADLNTYLQLLVAAPELTGWWGMAPIPGIPGENGEIERWSGGNIGMLSQGLGGFGGAGLASGTGGQSSAMIMKKSPNPEWGWKFIQWWMSSQIQEQFGSELEGFYGPAFRWNTANIDAFARLPWTPEELDPLLEQWRWYKSMVNVPGSYFIPRELNNAWNRTVIDGMNYRSSLEKAVLNINRELIRKQAEFGFRDASGKIIDTFDLPKVDRPWEGVERYVNNGS